MNISRRIFALGVKHLGIWCLLVLAIAPIKREAAGASNRYPPSIVNKAYTVAPSSRSRPRMERSKPSASVNKDSQGNPKPAKSDASNDNSKSKSTQSKKENRERKERNIEETLNVAQKYLEKGNYDRKAVNRQISDNKELSRVFTKYNKNILKEKKDPHDKLYASKLPYVSGEKGSELYAVVKIPVSGKGAYYRRYANKIVATNKELQKEITKKLLNSGDEFIIEMGAGGVYRNPYIKRKDGTIERLEWHHSPNYIGTVDLIPRGSHRGKGNMADHHISGKGGNEMFNTQYRH